MTLKTDAVAPVHTAVVRWTARAHAPAPADDDLPVTVSDGVLGWPGGSVAVPHGLTPSLAALAPKLALAAREHADLRARGAAVLELGSYDTQDFLLHQLALIDDPRAEVVAGARDGIQAGVASAFGARLVAPSGRRTAAASPPREDEVIAVLPLLHTEAWRFAPAVTLAVSETEWEAEAATGRLVHGLEALVHA